MTNNQSINECPVLSWSKVEGGGPLRVRVRALEDSSFARLNLKPGDECVIGYCDSRWPGVVDSIEYQRGRGR